MTTRLPLQTIFTTGANIYAIITNHLIWNHNDLKTLPDGSCQGLVYFKPEDATETMHRMKFQLRVDDTKADPGRYDIECHGGMHKRLNFHGGPAFSADRMTRFMECDAEQDAEEFTVFVSLPKPQAAHISAAGVLIGTVDILASDCQK